MKRGMFLLILIAFLGTLFFTFSARPKAPTQSALLYEALLPSWQVQRIASNLIAPTRIRITPDGKYMLVTQITGELLAFKKDSSSWNSQPILLAKVDTGSEGFPPEEAGLVGITFSHNFDENGTAFLLYSQKKDEKYFNKIAKTTLKENFLGKLIASQLVEIFEANIEGNVAHQITDALGVLYNNEPHLLVLIGE